MSAIQTGQLFTHLLEHTPCDHTGVICYFFLEKIFVLLCPDAASQVLKSQGQQIHQCYVLHHHSFKVGDLIWACYYTGRVKRVGGELITFMVLFHLRYDFDGTSWKGHMDELQS